jgi:hypothetical protein
MPSMSCGGRTKKNDRAATILEHRSDGILRALEGSPHVDPHHLALLQSQPQGEEPTRRRI